MKVITDLFFIEIYEKYVHAHTRWLESSVEGLKLSTSTKSRSNYVGYTLNIIVDSSFWSLLIWTAQEKIVTWFYSVLFFLVTTVCDCTCTEQTESLYGATPQVESGTLSIEASSHNNILPRDAMKVKRTHNRALENITIIRTQIKPDPVWSLGIHLL